MPTHHYPDSDQAKKDILERLRTSSPGRYVHLPEKPAGSFMVSSAESPIHQFMNSIIKVGGSCEVFPNMNKLIKELGNSLQEQNWNEIYCPSNDLVNQLKQLKSNMMISKSFTLGMEVAITKCESLIAETGTILVSSTLHNTRQVFPYTPIHLVIATVSQIKVTLEEAISDISEKYGDKFPSIITAITGPSRTADIEKTLILGAHGPKSLKVLLSLSEF